MGRLNRLYQTVDSNVKKKQELQASRAREYVQKMAQTEQFALYATLPDAETCINKIIDQTIEVNLNPVAQYTDTLRAMGLRQAHIRRITHHFYCAYCNSDENAENVPYETMLDDVAHYVYMHQELYSSINVDNID
jgi:hypothetical protein